MMLTRAESNSFVYENQDFFGFEDMKTQYYLIICFVSLMLPEVVKRTWRLHGVISSKSPVTSDEIRECERSTYRVSFSQQCTRSEEMHRKCIRRTLTCTFSGPFNREVLSCPDQELQTEYGFARQHQFCYFRI